MLDGALRQVRTARNLLFCGCIIVQTPFTSSRVQRLATAAVLGASALLAVLLAAANVWLGNLNQDDGWYLYAALEVARGHLPYRDFFFTQGPMLPLVYGHASPLWAPFGVAGGRAFTALLGLVSAVLTGALAARAVPRERRLAALVTAFLLTAGNVYHSYFMALPKTYALGSVLLLGGFLAVDSGRRGRRTLAAVGGVLLAAAAGTRVSLLAAIPVAGVWLFAWRRETRSAWLWFGLGALATLLLVYGPPLLVCRENFVFAQTFHAGRAGSGPIFAAGSVSRLARGYLPLIGVGLLALAAVRSQVGSQGGWRALDVRGPGLWVACFAAVFAVQLASPYPYDDYQVPVMPLVAAAVAALLWQSLPAVWPATAESAAARLWALAGLWVWAAIGAFSAPQNQEWFVIRQDRFWMTMKPQSDLAQLRRVAGWLRRHAGTDGQILTQDVYLAVEAGLRVPPGFEMGPFGYFPDLPTAAAEARRVLNRERLLAALRAAPARLAAFSGYGLAIGAPSMRELPVEEQRSLRAALAERYASIGAVRDFGQGHTPLELWARRSPEESAAPHPPAP